MEAKESRTATPLSAEPPAPSFAGLLRAAVGMLLGLTLLTGVAYPLVVTGLARAAFPERSAGSMIVQGGKVRGSRLIGQPFDDPKYFWGRISATTPSAYNANNSGGSNLGPTNHALTDAAKSRLDALRAADPAAAGDARKQAPVPVDLVTSSGSGLDPHITLAGAEYQVPRIARLRGISEDRVRQLMRAAIDDRDLVIFGEPGVNVLVVNLALDKAE